jgi:hypothetical protein
MHIISCSESEHQDLRSRSGGKKADWPRLSQKTIFSSGNFIPITYFLYICNSSKQELAFDMHEISWIDNAFDLTHTSDYHLSIQIGLDGFSYGILDTRMNKYLVFRHIPLTASKQQFLSRKVEAIFDEDEKLGASYKNVSITFSTNKVTLVPAEFSETAGALKIASLINEVGRTEELHTDEIRGFGYQLISSYPKELMAVLHRKYTDFTFCHKSIPLIQTTAAQRDEKKNTLMINFEKKYIRMIAFKNTQISLYNSFYFKNEPDFLYYTLNIWQNLLLDPDRDEILVGGFVADDSSYIRQLKKYVSNIRFLKPAEGFNYGNLFNKVQKHQFVSLLNTYSCV